MKQCELVDLLIGQHGAAIKCKLEWNKTVSLKKASLLFPEFWVNSDYVERSTACSIFYTKVCDF